MLVAVLLTFAAAVSAFETEEARILRLSTSLGLDLEITRAIVIETIAEMSTAGLLAMPSDGYDSSIGKVSHIGNYEMETDFRSLSETGGNWSYDCKTNPVEWARSGDMLNSYTTCASGKQQSPINIPVPAALDLISNSKPVENILFSTKSAVVSMSANLKFTCISNCGELKWEGATYNFVGVHFHGPSEHTVNNKQYAIEAHQVHESTDGVYSVFGTIFTASASVDSDATRLFDEMLAATSGVSEPIDLTPFRVKGSGFYQYDGSFTTPPCTEGVNWFVQATPVALYQRQITAYWALIGGYPGTARNVQPIHERTIDYNVDSITPSYTRPKVIWVAYIFGFMVISAGVAIAAHFYFNHVRKGAQDKLSAGIELESPLTSTL